MRPHPILALALANAEGAKSHREAKTVIDAERDFEALGNWLGLLRLPNVRLSTSSLLSDVLRHDALLTDGVSIIGYFADTGKPLAVFRDARSPEFNQVGEGLVSTADVVADGSEVASWLDDLVSRPMTIDTRRIATMRQLFPTPAQSPVQSWLDLCVPADG